MFQKKITFFGCFEEETAFSSCFEDLKVETASPYFEEENKIAFRRKSYFYVALMRNLYWFNVASKRKSYF